MDRSILGMNCRTDNGESPEDGGGFREVEGSWTPSMERTGLAHSSSSVRSRDGESSMQRVPSSKNTEGIYGSPSSGASFAEGSRGKPPFSRSQSNLGAQGGTSISSQSSEIQDRSTTRKRSVLSIKEGSLKHHSYLVEDIVSDQRTPPSVTIGDESNYHFIDFSPALGDFHGVKVTGKVAGSDMPETGQTAASNKEEKKEVKKTNKKKIYKESKSFEKQITTFALRLATMEKAARGMGALSFIWATVVILTSQNIEYTEFVIVFVIITAEGCRLFSGNHELELKNLTNNFFTNRLRSLGSGRASTVRSLTKTLTPHRAQEKEHQLTKNRSALSEDLPSKPSSTSEAGHAAGHTSVLIEPSVLLSLPLPNLGVGQVQKDRLVNQGMSRALFLLQLISALLCFGLATWRLVSQGFMAGILRFSLNVFYGLAVLEAGFFLLEKCYRVYKLIFRKLLERALQELDRDDETNNANKWHDTEHEMIKQFFHTVYAGCLKGSVFDSLDMDLVSFSIICLQSENIGRQFGGARLLNRFVSSGPDLDKPRGENDQKATDTLRRLGTSPGIMERLVEMLSWDANSEYPLLSNISTIICRLVAYNRNCSRIVALPGAMDAIVSLLWSYGNLEKENVHDWHRASNLRLTGLRILKFLCRDHQNSVQIGEAKGLLPILVMLVEVRQGVLTFLPPDKIENLSKRSYQVDVLRTYKLTLKVLRLLAAATNTLGVDPQPGLGGKKSSRGDLRHGIVSIVSTLSNLRDVIRYGDKQPKLQWLATDILYHLAMEDDLRNRIGSTGGVILHLFQLFAKGYINNESDSAANHEQRIEVMAKAGETLSRLLLQSEQNIQKLLRMNEKMRSPGSKPFIAVLIEFLDLKSSTPIACSAAQILRSLVKFAGSFESTMSEIMDSAENLLNLVNDCHEKNELYQAYLGLASRCWESLDPEKYTRLIAKSVCRKPFVRHLMANLRHAATTNRFPRIRRYTVELINTFVTKDNSFMTSIKNAHDINIKEMLELTLENISEVENYIIFSGLVGYTRHQEDMETLVARTIQEVEKYEKTTDEEHSRFLE